MPLKHESNQVNAEISLQATKKEIGMVCLNNPLKEIKKCLVY